MSGKGNVTLFNQNSNQKYSVPNDTSKSALHPRKSVTLTEVEEATAFFYETLDLFTANYKASKAALLQIIDMTEYEGTSFMNESEYLIAHFIKPTTVSTVAIAEKGKEVKNRTAQKVTIGPPGFLSYVVYVNKFLFDQSKFEVLVSNLTDRLVGILGMIRTFVLMVHDAAMRCYNYNDDLQTHDLLRQTEKMYSNLGLFNRAVFGGDMLYTTRSLTTDIRVVKANIPLSSIQAHLPDLFKDFYANMKNSQYIRGKDLLEMNMENMNLLQAQRLKTDINGNPDEAIELIPIPFIPTYNDIKTCVTTYAKWRYAVVIPYFKFASLKEDEDLFIVGASYQLRKINKAEIAAAFNKVNGSKDGSAAILITKQYCAIGYSGLLITKSKQSMDRSKVLTALQGKESLPSIIDMELDVDKERYVYQEKTCVEVHPKTPEMVRILPCAELKCVTYADSDDCPCRVDNSGEEVLFVLSNNHKQNFDACLRASGTTVIPWTSLKRYSPSVAKIAPLPNELQIVKKIVQKDDENMLRMEINMSHIGSGCIIAQPFVGNAAEGKIKLPPSIPETYGNSLPPLLNQTVTLNELKNNISSCTFDIDDAVFPSLSFTSFTSAVPIEKLPTPSEMRTDAPAPF